MRVILAEKASMGADIAAALGLKNKSRGFIEGVDPFGNKTICTWASGHLVEGVEPEDYSKDWCWPWAWDQLPMIPPEFKYRVVSDKRDVFNVVKEQLAKATELVVACDAGREGELIASLILEKAPCKAKTRLRLWTKSLTESAILEAYGKMKPWSAYKGKQDAAYGRSMADWLVGMTGSRAMSLRAWSMGRKGGGAWSIGRVMTPTLAILVARELEIRNFVPKDYHTLEGTFVHPAGTYTGKWFKGDKDSMEKPEEARGLLADLQGRPARVAKFDTRKVNKGPEQFYDQTAIQREANKRFGFTAKKTLDIAQELYDDKVLSYPRTGSRYLTHDDAAKIPTWLKTVAQLPQYAPFVAEIKNTKLGGRFIDDAEVEDHTALMPTEKAPNWGSMSEDQKKIYDLVVRRFLAAFFPDRIEAKTVLITEIAGAKGPESFKTTGTAVVDPGWSRVDTPAQSKAKKKGKKGEEEDGEEDKPLTLSGAPMAVGDGVTVKKLEALAKKTSPPKRMNEADLLAAMQSAGKDLDEEELREAMKECKGIGTVATRADIIEKLLSKGSPKKPKIPLVVREKQFLVPTDKGIDLIQMLPSDDLRSAELTARWETELDQIDKGQGSLEAFMARIEQYTRDIAATLRAGAPASAPGGSMNDPTNRMPATVLPDPCPRCGSPVSLKSWEGRFYTKCGTKTCYFGYDTDEHGTPTGKCVHCGGRTKTIPKGSKVCADCNKWQDSGGADGSPSGPGPSGATGLGTCPKCKKGSLRVIKGSNGHFVSCSDRDGCKLSYDSNEAGKAKGGTCAKCKGPVKKFPSGSKRCAVCDEWVNDDSKGPAKGGSRGGGASSGASGDRPPKPADAHCPNCGKLLKTIWTKKNKWARLCEDESKWFDA